MKIQLSTCNSNLSYKPAFKGLWGADDVNYSHDSIGSYHDVTKLYYPFSDETEEEIQRVVEKHSWSRETTAEELAQAKKLVADPVMHYESISVDVMERLPFTKKDYADFKVNKLSKLKTEIVEFTIDLLQKIRK